LRELFLAPFVLAVHEDTFVAYYRERVFGINVGLLIFVWDGFVEVDTFVSFF